MGAALETLGKASSPLSTMVVAASLATSSSSPQQNNPKEKDDDDIMVDDEHDTNIDSDVETNKIDRGGLGNDKTFMNDDASIGTCEEKSSKRDESYHSLNPDVDRDNKERDSGAAPIVVEEENPVMSDPNFGPLQLRRRSSIYRFRSSIRRSSMKVWEKARRTPLEQRRLYVWFTLSRLILSPALVVLAIVGLDCSGALEAANVPDLVKLVLIVNSSVPGALIIVVLLKSNPELHETAAVVAKVYFPTYIISIITIAAWTAVGLLVSIPDDEGNSFCAQWKMS